MKEELKIKDVMIGDWVDVRNNADPNTPHLERITPSHFLRDEHWYGIELVPEILEKNGFVKEEEERGFSEPYCVYVCDDFQYVIKIYPKNLMDRYSRLYIGEYDDSENASLLINHLHELQHALKLCGIEKTIEL